MWTPCWWPLPTTGMPGLQDDCAAGKDVYCEKPMSHTVEQAFAMMDASQNHQRIVQVGSQCRSSIVYAQAKQIFESVTPCVYGLVTGSSPTRRLSTFSRLTPALLKLTGQP